MRINAIGTRSRYWREMHRGSTLVERAFELARSGTIANVDLLARALKREGFDQVESHFSSSRTLTKELREACRLAWGATGREPIKAKRKFYG